MRRWARKRRNQHSHTQMKDLKLCQLTRKITMMIRVCKMFRQGLRGFREYQIMEETHCKASVFTTSSKKQGPLLFNYKDFKSQKGHFPPRAIEITKKIPAWRQEAELRMLCNLLQVIESFRTYSERLQELLAKVIRFERFGRRRVIVKKGHPGHSFYFIYRGKVAVTDDEDGSSAFLDLHPTMLHQGASFGEVALLSRVLRIATVVCMDETELLVVDREDFFANRLDEELQAEFQQRFDFFRNMDLFRTWPDELLQALSRQCKVEKYRFGQVICQDITQSGNALFIRQGHCDVLRLVDLPTCPSYYKWIWQHLQYQKHSKMDHKTLGWVSVLEQKPRDPDKKRFEEFQIKSYPVKDFSNLKSYKLKLSETYSTKDDPRACHHLTRKFGGHREFGEMLFRPHVLPRMSQRESSSPTPPLRGYSLPEELLDVPVGELESWELHRDSGKSSLTGEDSFSSPRSPSNQDKGVVTTEFGKLPVEAAGLHQILLPEGLQDKRPLILVSQGAEVIQLKINKLEGFLDRETNEKLTQMQIPYPSDDEICQRFLRENDWRIFHRDLKHLLVKPGETHCPRCLTADHCVAQAGVLNLRAPKGRARRPCSIFISTTSDHREQLPPLRLIHSISAPRPRLQELLPQYRHPGILMES
ncbi:cyclic nucleotide-binding domain-containing protein 2 isoform X2 [Ornithorhynchus anatinus]|uniref:cyclic nucleotide-binding domain-containing protein 2 isoform X2 n=1 Tax=Ornithorhynchus anatinus TaxID=9258 RepID=UPI0010A772AF|nr:cyclic nucleotide-binding domain-containing protein 2 isoform X2 [Ornithorhynchus anatinus]